jgi:16S rRNA (cytosine967-C5)-methyltransferase
MTPSARIRATEEALHFILNAPIPMDGVVGDYFRSRRYIGSKDRGDIAERLYTIMRHYGRLTWWTTRLNITPDARHLVILHLALVEKHSAGDIAALYDGSQYGPKILTSDETSLVADIAGQDMCPADMPDFVRVECPAEHEPTLRAQYGNDFETAMTAFLSPATLDVRFNGLKCTRDQAHASLTKDNVETTETPFSPWGLRLHNKAFLSATNAFRHGLIDIQDEGSQLIAYVCGARPGQQVLDFCAGGGGKTLALGNAMRNKGRIVAMDTVPQRLEKARLRLRRAGIADIVELRPLSDEQHRKWLRRQKETFDVVLTDVPLFGVGHMATQPRFPVAQFWPIA